MILYHYNIISCRFHLQMNETGINTVSVCISIHPGSVTSRLLPTGLVTLVSCGITD